MGTVKMQVSPHEFRSPESMNTSDSPSPRLFWEKGLGVEGYFQQAKEIRIT